MVFLRRNKPQGPRHWRHMLSISCLIGITACQATSHQTDLSVTPEQKAGDRGQVQYDAGAYLAAHQAAIGGDIPTAATRYTLALAKDPSSHTLMERSFRSLYLAGEIEHADAIASALETQGRPVGLGSEPSAAIAAQQRDWSGLQVIAQNMTEDSGNRGLGILFEAWALVFQAQGDAGLSRFFDLRPAESADIPSEMFYTQPALMMEYLGHDADAMEAARIAINRPEATTDTVIQMAGILARGGEVEEASRHIGDRLNRYYQVEFLQAGLAAGGSSMLVPPSPLLLLANASTDIALEKNTNIIGRIARLRLAHYLGPDHDRTSYHLGRILRQTDLIDQAMGSFSAVPADSPWHQPARLLQAIYLSQEERDFETAQAIFDALIVRDPRNPMLWRLTGNSLRRHGRFDEALIAYETAIELGGGEAKLNYYRGICLDNLDRDNEAETAFRRSLKQNPADAYVLNYLGYWLLEHGGNPEEAIGMIRGAVEAQPQNGFFIDSLGWGYYRLGHYRQAVVFLERAVMLEPADPTITDHLGDAYARTGRLREAVYEWKRALYYANEEVEPERIQNKIEAAEAELEK